MDFLPVYANLEEFKENYLNHFYDWKNDDLFKNLDFEDYLEMYRDVISDTYDDIMEEVKNKDFERIKSISTELIISDRVFKKYIEESYSDDPMEYEYVTQPDNYKNVRELINNDLLTFSDKDEYKIGIALSFFTYNINEIDQFLYHELIKLNAYKNLTTAVSSSTSTNRRHTAPVIIAMLKELKLFAELNKRGFAKGAIIESLYQIIGTNKKNIEKYYDSMIKLDNEHFKESHSKKAKDFLNSKGF